MTFLRHVATRGHMPPFPHPYNIRWYNLPRSHRVVTWPGSHQTFILRARRHGTPAVHRLSSLYTSSSCFSSSPVSAALLHRALMHRHGISLAYCCTRAATLGSTCAPLRSLACPSLQWRLRRGTLYLFYLFFSL